uniref:ribosomal protein L16 n=1 Tax=Chrysotila carterae TaxID=13221 RepID=UPI0023AAC0E0|nr:ribosomal protein L16 [Chrysotila carterae]WCH62792.1 ribosomal protein L16 [Chrysotila carterae]
MLSSKQKKAFSFQSITKKSQFSMSCLFDNVMLFSSETAWLDLSQLESVKKLLRKTIKKNTKLWFTKLRAFPVTKKPNEVRMGKGKGSFKALLLSTKRGVVLVESSHQKLDIFNLAKYKLSTKVQVTKRWS